MPYKDVETRRTNQRNYNRVASIDRLRDLGLEPVDVNNPHSELACNYCGKLSGRYANKKHRHYEGCFSEENENLSN